jgi:hypothetical protein
VAGKAASLKRTQLLAITAWLTATSGWRCWSLPFFLRINGYRLDLTDDEAFDVTLSVAAGQLDAEGIARSLRAAPAE